MLTLTFLNVTLSTPVLPKVKSKSAVIAGRDKVVPNKETLGKLVFKSKPTLLVAELIAKL